MTAPAPLADRSMRARRSSWCHLCHQRVTAGQLICRVTVHGQPKWPHAGCLVQAQQAARQAARPVEDVNLPPDGPDAA